VRRLSAIAVLSTAIIGCRSASHRSTPITQAIADKTMEHVAQTSAVVYPDIKRLAKLCSSRKLTFHIWCDKLVDYDSYVGWAGEGPFGAGYIEDGAKPAWVTYEDGPVTKTPQAAARKLYGMLLHGGPNMFPEHKPIEHETKKIGKTCIADITSENYTQPIHACCGN
jgi:hypothetical protein